MVNTVIIIKKWCRTWDTVYSVHGMSPPPPHTHPPAATNASLCTCTWFSDVDKRIAHLLTNDSRFHQLAEGLLATSPAALDALFNTDTVNVSVPS